MKVHHVTIGEVKGLLKAQELKLTSEMNKEIKVRVKEEVFKEAQEIKSQLKDELGF